MRSATRAVGLVLSAGLGLVPQQGRAEFYGEMKVFAWDSSSATAAPPQTSATLNGTEIQSFGTNDWVTFSGYFEAGTQTVEVATAASGYRLRQSPTDPDAVNDPDSDYGNPRHVMISESTNVVSVDFLFDPVVTAAATVRDAWTMERIEGAAIEFVINSGPSKDTVLTNYPWMASYASCWVSGAAGRFPSNTYLYAPEAYDLEINKAGYELFSSNNVITNAVAGDAFDFGTLLLQPVDANTNRIADAWETQYFGAGSCVVTNADADGDGMDNRAEYVAGTNPTNAASRLATAVASATNGLALTWSTAPDRTYCVSGTTNLCPASWVQVGGPWEAGSNQTEMVWVETNLDLSWNNSYRVDVVPCWWSGTNQVLVNTNLPSSSGGGGSTNGPPVP